MTDKIEPALTVKEWREAQAGETLFLEECNAMIPKWGLRLSGADIDGEIDITKGGKTACVLIALANAALPDSDPRKITREMMVRLREPHTKTCSMWWLSDYDGAQICDCGGDEQIAAIADALESYLPPEIT